MSRPLVTVQTGHEGDELRMITLPAVFAAPIRTDIVHHVHRDMNKNRRQPYAVNKDAGMNHAAESWGTGRAVARIPRVTGSGTHRAGQAAFGNMCRKGRMFAPTKTWRRWHRKINKGQRRYATVSALAASSVPSLVFARGHRIDNVNEVPVVIADDVIYGISKTKDAVQLLKNVEIFDDVTRVKESKKVRRGVGKTRNRRYKVRKGPLIVYHREDSKLVQAFRNIPGIELCHVSRLNLLQLAPGGHVGRLIVWTESAFKNLDNVFGTFTKESKQKSGYTLPRSRMANTDLSRLINSDEIQSVLRPKQFQPRFHPRNKNPLKNLGAMVKLNPYALTQKRRAILSAQNTHKNRRSQVTRSRASKKFLDNILFAPQVPEGYYERYQSHHDEEHHEEEHHEDSGEKHE